MGVKHWVRAMLALSALPSVAAALGLGDIRLNSALNSPLDAEIELVNATTEELNSLKAQLASRETFARYGLEWPAFLQSVQITRAKSADGRDVLRLRSTESITEPFVTLLIDANWGRGRLVREYTVLLDPPVFAPAQTAQPAPVAPATTTAPRSGTIERSPAPAEPRAADPSGAPPSGAAGGSVTVRRGDTLSGIARRLAGEAGVTTEQMMVAIYNSNAAAFDGSMNDLRAGAILRVPDAGTAAAIAVQAAAAEVRRQGAAWRGRASTASTTTAGEGRLRLVAPTEATASGSGGSTAGADAGEVAALRSRVAELEGRLAESQRMLELRNGELAQLQQRLNAATGGSTAAAPAVAAPATPPPATASGSAPTLLESAAPEPAVPPAADAEAPAGGELAAGVESPPPAVAETPMRPRVVEAPVEAPSLFGSLLEGLRQFWFIPVALLALIAGLLGFRRWQANRESKLDDTFVGERARPEDFSDTKELSLPVRTNDTAPLRQPNVAAPVSRGVVVEESGEFPQPAPAGRGAGAAAASSASAPLASDDTVSGETAINLDQGDPIAEADFHMAYGLYDQAADLIRLAIAREPQRRDLKVKLAEVFFVWGNRDEFLRSARELNASRDAGAPGEWDKLVIMGKQIAPEDPLFSQASLKGAGAGAGGLDLPLEGGENAVDFDVFGDGTGSLGGAKPAVPELDIGRALGDDESTGERPALEATAERAIDPTLDQGLDSTAERELDATVARGATGEFASSGATTREMLPRFEGDALEESLELSSEAGEAPTVEQPALRTGSPTIKAKVEAARRNIITPEQTAEVSIDDLGLDVGDVSKLDELDSPDAPTLLAGLDETSQTLLREAAAPARKQDDVGATSMIAALDTNAFKKADFDLSDLETTGTHGAASGNGIDLDIGGATGSNLPSIGSEIKPRASAEETLPSLEPVTISEVGTKIDLARAYMDMGDPDGARNILQEVLQEGSVSQKQEAQRLLDSLPG